MYVRLILNTRKTKMLSPRNRILLSPIKSSVCVNMPVPQLDFSPTKESDQEIDPTRIPTLPLNGSIPRITGKTLCNMLDGVYDECFDSLFIIDCRYNYEYQGGHIKGAQNINSPEKLESLFFSKIVPRATFVFHCEFSHNRGPQMAGIFRSIDREKNKERYPELFYPNVYILDGGYKEFYAEHKEFCEGGYTPMLDESHNINGDLVRSTTQFRENVEKLNNKRREALKLMTNSTSKLSQFQSPMVTFASSNSPMTTKMLNFLSSPIFNKNQ